MSHLDDLDDLADEFEAFCKKENLPAEGDAVDLLMNAHALKLTSDQLCYLHEFVQRWEAIALL